MFFKLFSCKKKYNVKLGAQETQLYNKYSADVYKTIVLNIENLDKNVLAMTTFFLGLSLIFLKDIVDDEKAIEEHIDDIVQEELDENAVPSKINRFLKFFSTYRR